MIFDFVPDFVEFDHTRDDLIHIIFNLYLDAFSVREIISYLRFMEISLSVNEVNNIIDCCLIINNL